LFRMRQFYEIYRTEEKVAPLARQLSWSHNMIIFGQSKHPEEREFYLHMAVQEKWSKRELERQFKAALFERSVTQPAKISAALKQTHPSALEVFRDAYMVEFLGLPGVHDETDLHQGLLGRLKEFLNELGRDFCFVRSQYPLQVGGRDFSLDLLFFHRGLNCLVAIELKVGRFEPEYLGKLGFYLEALDRDDASLTKTLLLVCCFVPARMTRSSSTPLTAACLQRLSPSIRFSFPTNICCKPSCMSSTH
jgi:predicted nuclease of restriction endonuclease-like (RecB) superfamily